MSRASLLWNSLSGTLLYLVGASMAFVMSPFLVRHLGNGGYGFWELLMGLVGYLGVLDMGIGPAVVRHVALARGQNDSTRLMQVINTGFFTFLCAGAAGALLVLVISIHPQWLFGTLPFSLTEGREVMAIAALMFLLTFSRATFTASLMGMQRHRIVNAVRSLLAIAQALVIYALLKHDDTHALLTLGAVSAVGLALEVCIAATILLRTLPQRLDPRQASWSEGRDLFRFGIKSAGIMAASSLVRQGLLFVLSHGLGAASVTFYALCGRLVEYGGQLITAVGFPITPYLAQAFGRSGVQGARESFEYTTRAMQFIQAGVTMGILWLGLPFLAHWMGPDYAVRGAPVFYCLVSAMSINVLGANASRMLVSLNRHGKAAIGGALLGVAAFILGVILVPRLGLMGAALAAASFSVSQNLMELILVTRALGLSLTEHTARTLRRLAPPWLAGSASLATLAILYPAHDYLHIAVHSVVAAVTYLTIGFLSVLTASERSRLVQWMRIRFWTRSIATAGV